MTIHSASIPNTHIDELNKVIQVMKKHSADV